MANIAKVNICDLYSKYYRFENNINFTRTLRSWRNLPKSWFTTAIYSHHVIYLIAISRKDLKNT